MVLKISYFVNTLRLPQQSRVPESIPFRRGIFQKNTKITTKRFKVIKYLTFFTTFQKEIIILDNKPKVGYNKQLNSN